ncbi:amidohydrolase family protein [Gracilibacillus halophilus YIM-C55.5]|uniref:Amidohydrolase family protein n=1 Tax=Gracilibacillus halophilus YIM-C55.5 TaxID=1308866 RepID=N4WL72_9BACI|nr:amidohydrolase [Gracilibacillus halophilus]ENH96932.1 amidohydrolase family protein [Gracilibacillus halophilus YIM-C55.5]
MGKLWFGGTIYTMENEQSSVEAVYTDQGIIIDTGNFTELKHRYAADITEYQDIQGSVMYPGFVDSHLHIVGHGEKIMQLDLSSMQSAQQVLQAVKEKASVMTNDEWLIGEGWNENQWDTPSLLTREDLDQICPQQPVVLKRVCRHAIIANSKALEIAGITQDTADPFGGKIVRDTNQEPTGYLLDSAQDDVFNVMPTISQQQLEKTIRMAVHDLLSKGLVGGHTEDLFYYGGFLKTLHAFQQVIPREYRFRSHLLVHHQVFDDMLTNRLHYGDGGEYTTLGAMKIFADGALGGRTAWLSTSYADDPKNKGIHIHSVEDLEELIQHARLYQHPVAVHAIGDEAVKTVATLLKKYPLKNGRKDRIIHAQVMNEDVLQLLEEIDVVLDIQPSFVASDFPWVMERLGEERTYASYPWKTYLNRGIACAAGSDAPIEDVHPLSGIKAAVTRQSSIDQQIYNRSEQLSVYDAIALYTKGSANVINHAHDRGMIRPGFVADFTVVEQDLYHVSPDDIDKVQNKMTVVNEEVMYDNR